MALSQQVEKLVLSVIGVLVLVDHHMFEAPAPSFPDILVSLQKTDGADQQVIEIHRVLLLETALVGPVDLRDRLLPPRADRVGVLSRRQQGILGP